jgi:hypothetical protein
MAEIRHRTIRANGIRMHVAEAGEGFPVVMCHGWPELWYSWRHQLPALAAAGFRAIAPDMRGYGGTDAPADPAEYRTSVISADILGLLDALALERAVASATTGAATTSGSSGSGTPIGARSWSASTRRTGRRGRCRRPSGSASSSARTATTCCGT